jgi:hypothetical protein
LGERRNWLTRALIVTVLLLGPATAMAQTSSANSQNLSDENLLIAVPEGYKVDFQQRTGNMLISEMVPVAQTVANWTEMGGLPRYRIESGRTGRREWLRLYGVAAELPTQQGHRQAGDHLVQGHCRE